MAVGRGRSHELVGSMMGAVYVHVLRTLARIDAVKADVKALQHGSVERFKRNLFHPPERFPLSTLEKFEAIENSVSVDDIVKIVSSLVAKIIVFFSILM